MITNLWADLLAIAAWIVANPIQTAVLGALALVGLVLAFLAARSIWKASTWLVRRYVAPRPAEDVLTIVAASIATGASAQGMWLFTGDVLHLPVLLRLLLFAFIEVAVVTSAVRARRNMRENHSAGIDGIAVWALTCLTAVLSAMHPSTFAEKVFRLAAPLVAAWLWERSMAIERHRIRGTGRIHWRLTPERLLVKFGLAETRDRTTQEVDAHRRLTRVALAAKRAKALRETGASERKMRAALARLDKAMDAAVEHTGLAVDLNKQETLLQQIAALYNTAHLIDAKPRAPWSPTPQTQVPAEALKAVADIARLEGRRQATGAALGDWSARPTSGPSTTAPEFTIERTSHPDHSRGGGPAEPGGWAAGADPLPAAPDHTRALPGPAQADRTSPRSGTGRGQRTTAKRTTTRTSKRTGPADRTSGQLRVDELFPLCLTLVEQMRANGVTLSRRNLQAALREQGESASNDIAAELVRQLSKRPPRERQVRTTASTPDRTMSPPPDQHPDRTTDRPSDNAGSSAAPDQPTDRTTDTPGETA